MKNTPFLPLVLITTFLLGTAPVMAATDPHSYAQPEKIVTKHIDLDLTVDVEKQTLGGFVVLTVDRKKSSASLVLDTKNLTITSIQLMEGTKLTNMNYTFGRPDEILGQKLEISFPKNTKGNKVKITYSASSKADGLLWNTGDQTISKRPFLSTASEPIGARTWIPCQDTPVVRASYKAKIHVVQPDLMVVMSATNPTNVNPKGDYNFSMDIPVPSYLIAMGVGKLGFKSTGKRTGVYAEPEILAQAAEEFSETEKQLAAAEKLYGKYAWGRYDLLVLPGSFAWGGMENPRLTFVTPSLITGKKDLVDVIAHEIAHSWSGNLVTNAQWSDVWINEGFTTYVQYRIIEELHGESIRMRDMSLDLLSLENDFKDKEQLKADDTRLKTDFKGRVPDEVFTSVPYVKGAALLYTIEQKVGKTKMDQFLKTYFAKHRFKSITTDEVIGELSKLVSPEVLTTWIDQPYFPKDEPKVSSSIIAHWDELIKNFLDKGTAPSEKEISEMTSKDRCYFLEAMTGKANKERIEKLDQAFAFSDSKDPEVLTLWYRLTLPKEYAQSMTNAPKFLAHVGRAKFVTPVYDAMIETKKGRKLAKETFEKNKLFYSPMVQARIEKKLKD